ncbi:MAG: tetratricopeptide repeat protein [Xanthobacteraceae bacterium]
MSDASDVFREVDEEVRREQLKKLWDRYGIYFVILAVLIVAAVAAWRGYSWWEAKKAAEAGDAFEAAITLSDGGKHAEAEAAFAKIAADSTSGYEQLARIREAAELAFQDPKAAVAAFEKVANDGAANPALRELAALRAGALSIDAGNYPDATRLLEPLAQPDRTFRHTARELLALAAWRQGDGAGTKRWFDTLTTDPLTPAATRSRAEMLMALVAAEAKS